MTAPRMVAPETVPEDRIDTSLRPQAIEDLAMFFQVVMCVTAPWGDAEI